MFSERAKKAQFDLVSMRVNRNALKGYQETAGTFFYSDNSMCLAGCNNPLLYDRDHELYCDECFQSMLEYANIECYSRCVKCRKLYTRYTPFKYCSICNEEEKVVEDFTKVDLNTNNK